MQSTNRRTGAHINATHHRTHAAKIKITTSIDAPTNVETAVGILSPISASA